MSTAIEWTEATWNPTTGCDRCSPGCDNCYALTLAARLKTMGQAKYQRDGDPRTSGPGFALTVHPATLDLPLRWRKPRRVFVNSMSDLFHPEVEYGFVADVFGYMARAQQHTFQVLTKRPHRMASIVGDDAGERPFRHFVQRKFENLTSHGDLGGVHADPDSFAWPLPNVWLGTSVENQRYADLRIKHLLMTPAAVRFLSIEPLLGPVVLRDELLVPRANLCGADPKTDADRRAINEIVKAVGRKLGWSGIDWVIVGGESGPGARPMQIEWAEQIVDQCRDAGVAVFVKQLGRVLGGKTHHDIATFPESLRVREYPQPV